MGYKRYLKAIYGSAREYGVSNEEIHEAVLVGFGKRSLTELNDEECQTLLDGLRGRQKRGQGASGHRMTRRGNAMGTAGKRGSAPAEGTAYLVKTREMEMLREAADLRGWSRETLDTFIRRQLRGRQIRTMRDFNRVFWGLKSMNRRDGLVGKYDEPLQRRETSDDLA